MIVIQLTPDELSAMIDAAITKAMPKYNQTEPEDTFMSIDEAAEFVGLVPATLYSLVSRGQIPVCKRASRLYFSKQELTDWIKSGRKKTTAELTAEAKSYIKSRLR